MHTYTPTASHDPVVEFDNGDLGNQTNLNNMVRALGNRTQLAYETNVTQASSLSTLQAQMLSASMPAVLDITPTLSATGDGGSYSGGENIFAFTKDHLSGNDGGVSGSTGLDTATYTGTGGGTKIIRLAPLSRYRLDLHIVLRADQGVASPAPSADTLANVKLETATNTAISAGVVSVRDITGTPSPAIDMGASPDHVVLRFGQAVLLRNTSASPIYARLRLTSPVNNGTYYVDQGNILVQYIGPTA